jgi:acyl-CoA thioester hydrolase
MTSVLDDTPAPAFSHALRIYWEDTDAGGVVFYANYLKFFERARTEWLRSRGFGQEQLRTELGAMFVVVHTNVRYLRPARLDDLLQISVDITDNSGAAMSFFQTARRGDDVLAEGDIRIACVDSTTFKPRRIPKAVAYTGPLSG